MNQARNSKPCASQQTRDRKSTRLNSSHGYISYAVFCLKKKKKELLIYDCDSTCATARTLYATRRNSYLRGTLCAYCSSSAPTTQDADIFVSSSDPSGRL